jgi:hypothetical protein
MPFKGPFGREHLDQHHHLARELPQSRQLYRMDMSLLIRRAMTAAGPQLSGGGQRSVQQPDEPVHHEGCRQPDGGAGRRARRPATAPARRLARTAGSTNATISSTPAAAKRGAKAWRNRRLIPVARGTRAARAARHAASRTGLAVVWRNAQGHPGRCRSVRPTCTAPAARKIPVTTRCSMSGPRSAGKARSRRPRAARRLAPAPSRGARRQRRRLPTAFQCTSRV